MVRKSDSDSEASITSEAAGDIFEAVVEKIDSKLLQSADGNIHI